MASLTRRAFLCASIAGSVGAFAAGCSRNGRSSLYVMDWAHYIPTRIIQKFEAAFGVRVQYQAYGSNQEMLNRLSLAEYPWDIAFPCQQYLAGMKQRSLLRRLDHAKLPNLANLAPRFQKPSWDPSLQHAVPVSWGATGVAYSRQIRFEILRWADLWDERLRERLTMLNDRDEVLAAALLKLGLPLNSSDPAHLAAARKEAIAQKRLVHSYGILESKDRLISGEFQVSHLWSNLAGQAIAAAPNIHFVFPEEGFPLYAENAVLLNTSQNPDAAHAFINFLLDPEVAAMLSEYAYTPSTVANSQSFLPLRLREDRLLFPGEDVIKRGQWFEPQTVEAAQIRQQTWDAILAG